METAITARYDIINRIGAGSMGTVYQVTDRTDSRLHALKVVRKVDVSDPVNKLSMRRETAALTRFKHPNIVRFHHAYEDARYFFLATEYCSQGDLTALLRRTSVGVPEDQALSIMRQVFSALAYLHSHGVSHRDVKLQNVLIAPDGSVRLADLGLVHWRKKEGAAKANQNPKLAVSTRLCGTVEYAAPEVLMRKEHVPQYADMWACGVTLYMLLTRATPFRSVVWDELSSRAANLNIVALLGGEALAHVHLPCRQLLEGLLCANPSSRISANDAIALCDEGLATLAPAQRRHYQ